MPYLTTAEIWTGNFRVNVLTTILLTEALRDLLADNGRILLLSSIAAIRGGGSGSYGAAKRPCTRTRTTWLRTWAHAASPSTSSPRASSMTPSSSAAG